MGFGLGIERLLLLLEAIGVRPLEDAPDVYAIVPAAEAMPAAMTACEALRASGVKVLMHGAGTDSWGGMKGQFKRADASGARFALVFGADELARGEVALKSLRDAAVPQRTVALAEAATWAAEVRNA